MGGVSITPLLQLVALSPLMERRPISRWTPARRPRRSSMSRAGVASSYLPALEGFLDNPLAGSE